MIAEKDWAVFARYGDLLDGMEDQLMDRWEQSPRLCSWDEFYEQFIEDVFALMQNFGPDHPDDARPPRHRRKRLQAA